MKKLLAIVLVVAVVAIGSGVALAGNNYNGNGAPSGTHYSLNIIGVPKGKTADMDNTSGHTIFVPLEGNTKIWLCDSAVCADGGYQVLDRNGTDGDGATFALPNPDPNGDGTTDYAVYARALGTPGGKSFTTTCAYDDGELVCSVITLKLERNTGKSTFTNVSKYLLFIYADINDDGVQERVSLFDNRLQDYFWNYDNQGLKLAQLRFYPEPYTAPEPPMPCLTSISPATGAVNSTVTYTITGSDGTGSCAAVDFTTESITKNDVSFGPYTTTNWVVVDSATQLTANVTIKSGAATGWRLVYVTLADGTTLNIDFTVTP